MKVTSLRVTDYGLFGLAFESSLASNKSQKPTKGPAPCTRLSKKLLILYTIATATPPLLFLAVRGKTFTKLPTMPSISDTSSILFFSPIVPSLLLATPLCPSARDPPSARPC